MGALGIGDETLVVAYDATSGSVAARLWWMLRNQGTRSGRARRWLAGVGQGRLARGDCCPRAAPGGLSSVRGPWQDTADRDQLTSHLGEVVFLDAESRSGIGAPPNRLTRLPGISPPR